MKKLNYFALGALLVGSSFNLAHAQRETPDRAQQRQQRRENMQNMTPEERQQYFQNRMQERLKNMTPEQRQQWEDRRQQMQDQMRAQGIDPNDPNAWQQMRGNGGGRNGGNNGGNRDANRRQLLTAAGITETTVQDAIIAFLNEQETARQPLLQLARDAAASLKTVQNPVVPVAANADGTAPAAAPVAPAPTEQDVASAFAKYETAVAQDRIRYAEALKALDQKINYSTNTRLKSFLTLAGVLDYDALALGGISAILAPSLTDQGAGGGRQGQGRGNRQAQLPTGAATTTAQAGG